MGTTVTTNLALIKPDANESIKVGPGVGWPAQNTINCDKIDALFRAQTLTWTPTFTASSVNPILGSGGFVEGKYVRLFPRMVFGFFRIDFGTTGANGGTGAYRMSLPPVAIDSALAAFNDSVVVGKAIFQDSSAVLTSDAFLVKYEIANNVFTFPTPSASLWGATNPVAIGQSDKLSGYFMYPTAAP